MKNLNNLNGLKSLKKGLIGVGLGTMLSLSVTSAFAEDINSTTEDIITPNCKQYALFLQVNSKIIENTVDKTNIREMNPIDAYLLFSTMSNDLDKLNPLSFCDASNTKDAMIIKADTLTRKLLKDGKRIIKESLDK